MQHIVSDIHKISAPVKGLFDFLADTNHLEALMPDKVKNWRSDISACTFEIEGMASLQMQIQQKTAHTRIQWESYGKNPFEFILFVDIKALHEDSAEIYFQLDADMNPMLAMMAKRPLKNLLNHFCTALQEKYSY